LPLLARLLGEKATCFATLCLLRLVVLRDPEVKPGTRVQGVTLAGEGKETESVSVFDAEESKPSSPVIISGVEHYLFQVLDIVLAKMKDGVVSATQFTYISPYMFCSLNRSGYAT
jgi:hypothetical protein